MKTAEQVLRKYYNPLHGIGSLALMQLELTMKEYAIEVAKESLKNASDKLESLNFENKLDNPYMAIDIVKSQSNIPNLD